MTGRPKYPQPLSPSAPTIIQTATHGGQAHELMLKRPREQERENTRFCLEHCHRKKPCSGTIKQIEECRREARIKGEIDK